MKKYETKPLRKVGATARLTAHQMATICKEYWHFQDLMEEAARFSPTALAKKHGIAAPTVIDYALARHKAHPDFGLSRREVRAKYTALRAQRRAEFEARQGSLPFDLMADVAADEPHRRLMRMPQAAMAPTAPAAQQAAA